MSRSFHLLIGLMLLHNSQCKEHHTQTKPSQVNHIWHCVLIQKHCFQLLKNFPCIRRFFPVSFRDVTSLPSNTLHLSGTSHNSGNFLMILKTAVHLFGAELPSKRATLCSGILFKQFTFLLSFKTFTEATLLIEFKK